MKKSNSIVYVLLALLLVAILSAISMTVSLNESFVFWEVAPSLVAVILALAGIIILLSHIKQGTPCVSTSQLFDRIPANKVVCFEQFSEFDEDGKKYVMLYFTSIPEKSKKLQQCLCYIPKDKIATEDISKLAGYEVFLQKGVSGDFYMYAPQRRKIKEHTSSTKVKTIEKVKS